MARYSTKIKPRKPQKANRLPLWLALVGVVLVLLAFFAISNGERQRKANIQVTGSPRLSVDQESIDHGNVRLGTTQQTDVRVTNTGDQPLRFTEAPYIEVREGC